MQVVNSVAETCRNICVGYGVLVLICYVAWYAHTKWRKNKDD
jgi:hypothetical protein